MKSKLKITILSFNILTLCFIVQRVNAQAFQRGNMIVSAGYGFPNMVGKYYQPYQDYLLFIIPAFGFDLDACKKYDNFNTSSLGPIFGKIQYALSDRKGLGLHFGYATRNVEFLRQSHAPSGDSAIYYYKINLSTIGIMFCGNYHFGDFDRFDIYLSYAISYRKGFSKTTTDDPYPNGIGRFQLFPIGIAYTVGACYYFTDYIGVYSEIGLAKAPFQIGLVVKHYHLD